MARRPIVVDGANVAHEESTVDGRPRMANLVAMRRALEEAGYEPTIIVDASLRHDIDDPHQLEALFDDQRIYQAPAGTEADAFILQRAGQLDCRVVSNDTFERYRERYPWVHERRLPYMIVEGDVLLHRPLSEDESG